MSTTMAKPKIQRKPIKPTNQKIKKQSQNQKQNNPQKPEMMKQPYWSVVRGLLTCKHLQAVQLPQQQAAMDESSNKKCKKMRCSGSLCSNTKITTHRIELGSPEVPPHKKRAANSSNETSSRSIKAPPLYELNNNGVVSTSSSSLSASSNLPSSAVGSFRAMPFRRFSGCYECRMVVDPVLGFARDPSLRGTICSCPECGAIFMKAENLELHQAVRHAGT